MIEDNQIDEQNKKERLLSPLEIEKPSYRDTDSAEEERDSNKLPRKSDSNQDQSSSPKRSNKSRTSKVAVDGSTKRSKGTLRASDGGRRTGRAAERKQGHRFLCCCDSKRAVIFLNLIMLLWCVFTFTFTVLRVDPTTEGYIRLMTVRGSSLLVTLCTIMGAYWYSKSIVFIGLAFTCFLMVEAIIECVRYDWSPGGDNENGKLEVLAPLLWNVLIFYADAAFIAELADGTLTPENYKRRERFSCCCYVLDQIL